MRRMNKPIGVNNAKKITPNTRGLTILPNNKPNRIHSVFNGSKILGLIMVTTRNKNPNIENPYAAEKTPPRNE